MAIVINLPFPTPQQNLKWGWPNISNASNAITQGMNLTGYQNNSAAAVPIWLTQFLTGSNLMIMFNRVLGANFNDETIRPIIPYPYIVDDNANIEPLAEVPEQQRYYRIVQWIAQNGNMDDTGEFVYSPASSTSVSFAQAGQPCFGFQANGSGGWNFIIASVGAFPGNITEFIPLPTVTGSEWNAFEFEFFAATASKQAFANMSVNGILIASRTWQGGASVNLPLISTVLNGNKILGGIRAADAGASLIVGPMYVEQGRFTKAGLELTGV